MFGSRKDDEKKAKRSFWPWGRRSRDEVSEEQVEAKAEPEVEDVVSTVETPEITPESASESSAGVDAAREIVPEVVQGAADKPVHPESPEESAHKAPEASDKEVQVVAATEIPQAAQPDKTPVDEESKPEAKGGFFARMRQGLSKTRNVLVEGVAELFIGKKEIDDDLLDELETQLLVADVGVEATTDIIEKLTRKVNYQELDDADALMAALQSELADILEPADQPLVIPKQDTPFVVLVVGVNGVGKTTTIGKLARKFQSEGRKVMLAAGDTFRAAAVEQLQVWGERNEIPVVAQHTGADSASVIFDAFEAARARNIDVLIADTAGRLHNKEHLMEELKKVKRVLGKLDPDAPHEVLLVLDAGTGQNALSQARLFHETVQLTGMALTKLDGTAKGGVIFALSKQMKLPIRFLGVGEQIDDLRPFSAKEFVKALFSREG
ncbi:signal recognition particle-docking protein FtsY [Endozoicomonas sp. YOMI1]|uniref:signal recognition particle-docking protein FtsY n=1 Tax=Endozoicomonas sp. YOMI1 TaxID=2828739 RepID=UPI0021476557|nr:signal recognition particle-docking protein FtsY [Endozoicomonas sp. YOMI1]